MTEESTESTENDDSGQDSETVTTEETSVEGPVLNDPADLAETSPGAPQAVEQTTTVSETTESGSDDSDN